VRCRPTIRSRRKEETPPPVWTYGNRNVQAAAIHPATGELWIGEHGPQGGDEVNVALAGRNFGWPNVSYGCNYGAPVGTACRIGGGTHGPAYTEPAAYWYPTSTAPGGMLFYTGSRFPEWQGSLFVGGLSGRTLWRFVIDGHAIVGQEPFLCRAARDPGHQAGPGRLDLRDQP
jgi:aldose sugar dehydrogenase